MKRIGLTYNPVSEQYGINSDSSFFFNNQTHIMKEPLSIKHLYSYLKDKGWLKKKMEVFVEKKTKKNLSNLIKIIQEINPNAKLKFI